MARVANVAVATINGPSARAPSRRHVRCSARIGVIRDEYAPGSQESDEALMAAYVSGDNGAFELLFARNAPMVFKMGLRALRSPSAASDLVQDTFLHLHRARLNFRPGSRLRPWLATIALNCVRARFRHAGRKKEIALTEELEALLVVDCPEPLARFEAEHARDEITRALRQLPRAQREVIEMHWFRGCSFREIAVALGTTLSAAKVRAHRGYARLRIVLERSIPFPSPTE
jgi:RNA polymerase sigma-70 factor, ECF subfamily